MYEITPKDIKYCDALCTSFYKKYGRLPTEDDKQDARLGMVEAAQKYDPERGVKFITFARWAILSAVLHSSRRSADAYDNFESHLDYSIEMADYQISIAFENNHTLEDLTTKKDILHKTLLRIRKRERAWILAHLFDGIAYVELAEKWPYSRQALHFRVIKAIRSAIASMKMDEINENKR